MRSVTPWTPWRRMSSACWNASTTLALRSTTSSRRSLGMEMTVSATSRRASMPSSAWRCRRLPSNPNGLVTMAMVTAPSSRAICATTGAPPVPVPPPSPAVTNTRSAPRSAALSWSRLTSMASRPTSGLAPPPSPCVISWPMWILTSASHTSSCCTSVLTAMNSTPLTPESTMRFTALVPAPPIPTTLMVVTYGRPLTGASGPVGSGIAPPLSVRRKSSLSPSFMLGRSAIQHLPREGAVRFCSPASGIVLEHR